MRSSPIPGRWCAAWRSRRTWRTCRAPWWPSRWPTAWPCAWRFSSCCWAASCRACRRCPPLPDVTLVIRGGTVVGPEGLTRADVAIAGAAVVGVSESIEAPAGARVLDARGCLVGPGLVDLHAHLRQPGREEAETIETGARAAALGGYTALVAMPNTEPAIDSAGVAAEVLALGRGGLA